MSSNRPSFNIGGISAESLALEFGTPLYVYDSETIIKQLESLKAAFGGKAKVKFAAKSLTNLSVLKLLRREGAGIDAVSIDEVRIALHAGFKPDAIMFTPNNVSFREIEEAVALGTEITLDNLPILERFGATYGGNYQVGIRLNPHIMAGGNAKISTGHSHSKFGISIQQQMRIIETITRHRMRISGLHIHTGSEISDPGVYERMAGIMLEIATYFPDLRFVDFGGGFKVPYRPGDQVTDINAVGKILTEAVKEHESKHGNEIEIRVEPGKFLTSGAGFLITEATVIKETPSVTFVGVNSGLNHLIRPMMYGAWHEIINVSNPEGLVKTYTVAGNICETDNFGEDRRLNEVREGDLIVILNAGAYGYSMASNYNSRPRPAEVLVHEGKARLIRRRENLDDLLRTQIDLSI